MQGQRLYFGFVHAGQQQTLLVVQPRPGPDMVFGRSEDPHVEQVEKGAIEIGGRIPLKGGVVLADHAPTGQGRTTTTTSMVVTTALEQYSTSGQDQSDLGTRPVVETGRVRSRSRTTTVLGCEEGSIKDW